MSGSIFLYITNDGDVYKIPKPKYNDFKPIQHLANKEVILVILMYKTLNRKPLELELISFSENTLNESGQFEYTTEDLKEITYNFVKFGYSTAEDLASSDMPIPIPRYPKNIPTAIQKTALYNYIKTNYPMLYKDCPYLVENHIQSVERNFKEHQRLIKEANIIKQKKR